MFLPYKAMLAFFFPLLSMDSVKCDQSCPEAKNYYFLDRSKELLDSFFKLQNNVTDESAILKLSNGNFTNIISCLFSFHNRTIWVTMEVIRKKTSLILTRIRVCLVFTFFFLIIFTFINVKCLKPLKVVLH